VIDRALWILTKALVFNVLAERDWVVVLCRFPPRFVRETGGKLIWKKPKKTLAQELTADNLFLFFRNGGGKDCSS